MLPASSTATSSSLLFAQRTPSSKSVRGPSTRTPWSTRVCCSASTPTRRLSAGRSFVSQLHRSLTSSLILASFHSQTGAHCEEEQQEAQGPQGCRRGFLEDSLRSLSTFICVASAVGVGVVIGRCDSYASPRMIFTGQPRMSNLDSVLNMLLHRQTNSIGCPSSAYPALAQVMS